MPLKFTGEHVVAYRTPWETTSRGSIVRYKGSRMTPAEKEVNAWEGVWQRCGLCGEVMDSGPYGGRFKRTGLFFFYLKRLKKTP